MATMTPEEKVGQLFLVAFWDRNPSPPSRAGQLIQQYKVGGVVLMVGNNNQINGVPSTTGDTARLTNLLQGMALASMVLPTPGRASPYSSPPTAQ